MMRMLLHTIGSRLVGFCALLLLALGLNAPLKASHIAGNDITYTYIAPDTILINVYWYTFCAGAPSLQVNPNNPFGQFGSNGMPFNYAWCVNPTPPITGTCGGGCPDPVLVGTWQFDLAFFQTVAPLCDGQSSNCQFTPNYSASGTQDITAARYWAKFYIGNGTCDVEFRIYQNARNSGINNIQSSGSWSLWNSVHIDRSNLPNSSPQFSTLPAPYLCAGQPFTFNQGAFDPDGDSLSYAFVPCKTSTSALAPGTALPIAPAVPPFTPSYFLVTSPPNSIFFDPVSGDVSLTPAPALTQKGIACISVTEWRAGVPIGQVVRDIQFSVIVCNNNIPSWSYNQTNVGSPQDTIDVDTVTSCTGDSINFNVYFVDNDSDAVTFTFNAGLLPNPTFTLLPKPNDTTYAFNFRHPPLPPRTQPYTFVVRGQDDACPINGVFERTIRFVVGGGSLSIGHFASVDCDVANLSAPVFGGTGGSLFYTWSGDGGLTANPNADSSTLSHVYPDTGSYQYFIEVKDAYNCTTRDSGLVIIQSKGIDTTVSISDPNICQYDTLVIDYTGIDSAASINWVFGLGAIPPSAVGPGPHNVIFTVSGPKNITADYELNGCTRLANYAINVRQKPLVFAGADADFCANTAGVTLEAVTNTAGLDCDFSWTPLNGLATPNDSITNAKPLITRTYTIVVNCGGCNSDPDDVEVKVLDIPQAFVLAGSTSSCYGGTGVQLPGGANSGHPPYSYEWFPINNITNPYVAQPTAAPDTTTRYFMVATDSFGCTDTTSILVNVIPSPKANAGPDRTICPGGTPAVLQGSGDNNGYPLGSFSYQWFPATGLNNAFVQNPIAGPSFTTTYTLVVTNNLTGCSSSVFPADTGSTMSVFVGKPPKPNAGNDASICLGDSSLLGLPPSGGGPAYTYKWTPAIGLNNPNLQQPKASPAATTVYYLKVISNGCESDADTVKLTVNPYPTVAATPAFSVCYGESVQLETTTGGVAGPYTYRWDPPAGLSDPSVAQPEASPETTTTYQFYASYLGCETPVPAPVLVTVVPKAVVDADTTSPNNYHVLCFGESYTLPAKAELPPGVPANTPINLSWTPAAELDNPGSLNPFVAAPQSRVYVLTASLGIGGCIAQDSLELYVLPEIDANISASADSICRTQFATLTGTGGTANAVYAWSPATGLNTTVGAQVLANPQTTTTYVLTLTENGCTDADSLTLVVLPQPEARFSASYTSGCEGLEVKLVNESIDANAYQWSFGDGGVSNDENPLHTYTVPGVYTVELTALAQEGCQASNTFSLPVSVGGALQTGFETDPTSGSVLVLPNSSVTFQSTSTGAYSHVWLFGDGQSATGSFARHTYEQPGTYVVDLVVTDDKGCIYKNSSVQFEVVVPQSEWPTVFSPNGDGQNDTWSLNYTGEGSVSVNIADRWGKVVFSTNSREATWDGSDLNGEPLQEGVYFYVIELGNKPYKGSITLVR